MTCSCNTQWCFDCGKEPHWPATCEQTADYIEEAVKRGNINTKSGATNLAHFPSWRNTKKCPKCRNAIEKNEGCIHMTCPICRYEFCWGCLRDFSEKHHDCRKKPDYEQDIKLFNTNHEKHDTLKETERAFEKAIGWREHNQRLFKTDSKLSVFMHEWIFILQWSYTVLYASCKKKVSNNSLRNYLETVPSSVESVSKKVTSIYNYKRNTTHDLELLQQTVKDEIREVYERVKPLQMEIIKADKHNSMKH